MNSFLKKLFSTFLLTVLTLIVGCNVDDVTSSTASVTLQSSSYTNDGSVAYIFKPEIMALTSFLLPTAYGAAVTDFRFCITEMKIVSSVNGAPSASQEAVLGLIDVSNQNASVEWGAIQLEDGAEISEIHLEVHHDAERCGGATYSVSYGGQELTADLEFKFKFNPSIQVRHGDTVNLSLGVIAKAMEDASIAGQFSNEQIGNYVKADTIGEASEL